MSRDLQNPVSFKTVPGRNRTQKWHQASTHSYDGDDWRGYDPFDEYDDQSNIPPIPTQMPDLQQTKLARVNSFERGDERRTFSASADPSASRISSPPDVQVAPAPILHREFTDPESVPAPLARHAPALTDLDQLPQRRSSLSHPVTSGTQRLSVALPSEVSAVPQADKPLPFIRPSDIYKRMAEEREKLQQSGHDSRSSFDSTERASSDLHGSSNRLGLDTVIETREFRVRSAEDDMNGRTSQATPEDGSLQHRPSEGFRSAVRHAFDRTNDSSSLSHDNSQSQDNSGSCVSRSNTDSTSGISPIMSRVPSGATAQSRLQDKVPGSVTPIAEEPLSAGPGSRQASGSYYISRKPSPGRPTTATTPQLPQPEIVPGYTRNLELSAHGNSPARYATIGDSSSRRLSQPLSAEEIHDERNSMASDLEPPTARSGFSDAPAAPQITTRGRRGTDYSVREADLAHAVNLSPESDEHSPAVAEIQRFDQQLFLHTHTGTPTSATRPLTSSAAEIQDTTPIASARSSPTKSRVKDMAGKYQEIYESSRRNSAASIGSNRPILISTAASGHSGAQQTGRSDHEIDYVNTVERPSATRNQSFQPNLPGGWISSALTPSMDKPGYGNVQADQSMDLAPATTKVALVEVPIARTTTMSKEGNSNALDAVKNIGTQLGEAIVASVGTNHQTRDFGAKEDTLAPKATQMDAEIPRRNIYPTHPLLRRHDTESAEESSSWPSSGASTPIQPASDNHADVFNAVAPLRLSTRAEHIDHPERPVELTSLSSKVRPDDSESDRLRKEIVRSLSPVSRTVHVSSALSDDDARPQDAIGGAVIAGDSSPQDVLTLDNQPAGTKQMAAGRSLAEIGESTQPSVQSIDSQSFEIQPKAAYERPRNKELQVVNAAVETPSPVEERIQSSVFSRTSTAGAAAADTKASPSSGSRLEKPAVLDAVRDDELDKNQDRNLSPISEPAESVLTDNSSVRLPAYLAPDEAPNVGTSPTIPEKHAPSTDDTADSDPLPITTTPTDPIPPFRSILAIRSQGDRIRTYNETRQRFAEMNTGLDDWLDNMMSKHSEYANIRAHDIASPETAALYKRGHKTNPSMIKIPMPFSAPQGSDSTKSASAGVIAEDTTIGDDPIDRIQQRGKDFMKSAGVLGGKAQAGAKGLFAKGRSRLGGGGGGSKREPNHKVN